MARRVVGNWLVVRGWGVSEGRVEDRSGGMILLGLVEETRTVYVARFGIDSM